MPSPPRRILVLRALQLGDLLCAVPAFRSLRAGCPEAEITLLGLPWAEGFVHRFARYLDRYAAFPGFPGIPEVQLRPPALVEFLREAQGRYDLAVQMQGNGMFSNQFVMLLGARRAAGFCLPALHCPDPQTFLPYPAQQNEVMRHLRLMEHLGMPPRGFDLEFPLLDEEVARCERLLLDHGLEEGRYACVHPGARDEARRWPPQRFAAVADALSGLGLRVVLTGTAEERGITGAVASASRSSPLDLAGKTSLGVLAALVRGAAIVVCNDTGISHVAAAVRTPSVVVFSWSDPDRWAPLDRQRHRILVSRAIRQGGCRHALDGGACLKDACASDIPPPEVAGGLDVSAEAAIAEAVSLLGTRAPSGRGG